MRLDASSSSRFAGRAVIVTGAGGGIGRAVSRRFAAEGAAVIVADVMEGPARETASLVVSDGGRALAVVADHTDRAQVRGMIAAAHGEIGRLDVLVNNAGVIPRTPLLDVSDEDWRRILDANLFGPFLCSQEAIRTWVAAGVRGNIVNVASVESVAAFPEQVPYAASKGGVLMMTRAMALDAAVWGIRVNAVGPGTIDKGQYATNPQRRAEYERLYPLGRLGRPDDVAGAVLFLASDDASWVTGEILFVDGGYLIR
jgi:NAD(P)-dependent dehydrogenase (short-subunit alcohol dehydrogenase family)